MHGPSGLSDQIYTCPVCHRLPSWGLADIYNLISLYVQHEYYYGYVQWHDLGDASLQAGTGITKLIPHLSGEGQDLLQKLLMYNPEDRISAKQALRHAFFREIRFASSSCKSCKGFPHSMDMLLMALDMSYFASFVSTWQVLVATSSRVLMRFLSHQYCPLTPPTL